MIQFHFFPHCFYDFHCPENKGSLFSILIPDKVFQHRGNFDRYVTGEPLHSAQTRPIKHPTQILHRVPTPFQQHHMARQQLEKLCLSLQFNSICKINPSPTYQKHLEDCGYGNNG